MPSDEEILTSLAQRQEEINAAWDRVEAKAKELVAQTGQTATTISIFCGYGNFTHYDEERFDWTDPDGARHTLEWGEVEGMDAAWEALGGRLYDLASLTYPSPGEVDREWLQLGDHDLALLIYGVEDDEGFYNEEESPIYQRFLEIDRARSQ